MYYNIHSDFIDSRLISILKEALNTCDGVASKIESHPMKEYFLQSVFLKMTGSQEQKMKCICWQLATNNYRYRYEYLNNKSYGECSSIKDKTEIFKDIISCIKDNEPKFNLSHIWNEYQLSNATISSERRNWEQKIKKMWEHEAAKKIKTIELKEGTTLNNIQKDQIRENIKKNILKRSDFETHLSNIKKEAILKRILSEIESVFFQSPLRIWEAINLDYYAKSSAKLFKKERICNESKNGKELLDHCLRDLYLRIVYNHRNRCAHNTTSYQENLPTLNTLSDDSYVYENYLFRFALLIIIDEVFIRLFKYYEKLQKDIY